MGEVMDHCEVRRGYGYLGGVGHSRHGGCNRLRPAPGPAPVDNPPGDLLHLLPRLELVALLPVLGGLATAGGSSTAPHCLLQGVGQAHRDGTEILLQC